MVPEQLKKYGIPCLSNRQHKKFLSLDCNSWQKLSDFWKVWGHAILLAPDLATIKPNLVQRVIRDTLIFKFWFLNKCLETLKREKNLFSSKSRPNMAEISGSDQNSGQRRGQTVFKFGRGILTIVKWIKAHSNWSQEKLFLDRVITRPEEIGFYNTTDKYPLLKSFRSIKRLYNLYDRKPLDLLDTELVKYLASLRSIGRSLPCADGHQVLDDTLQTIDILSHPFEINHSLKLRVKSYLEEIYTNVLPLADKAFGYKTFVRSSHISVTTSATCNTSRSRGGNVADVRNWYNSLEKCHLHIFKPNDTTIIPYKVVSHGNLHDQLYDCFGYHSTSKKSLDGFEDVNLLSKLYVDVQSEVDIDTLIKDYDLDMSKVAPRQLGKILLLLSSGKVYPLGTWSQKPDLEIVTMFPDGEIRIPLWNSSHPKIFKISGNRVRCRLVSSETGGYKTRIVTANETHIGILMKFTKFLIRPWIGLIKPIRLGSKASALWHFVKDNNKTAILDNFPVIYSSDLKNATDYIPLDLVELIWETFAKCSSAYYGILPCHTFLSLVNVPRLIELDKSLIKLFSNSNISVPDNFIQMRGSLMGDPMSFLTLSIVNLCVDLQLQRLTKIYSNIDSLSAPSIILGDDFLALARDIQIPKLLDKYYSQLGLVLSSKHGVSPKFGVFAEDWCLLNQGHLIYLDTIKLRLLNSIPAKWGLDHRAAVLGKARQIKNIYEWSSIGYYKLLLPKLFIDQFHREYKYSLCYIDKRLPLNLPYAYGGLDFPGDEKDFPFSLQVLYYLENNLRRATDPLDKFILLGKLKRLNSSYSKGIETHFKTVFKCFKKYFSKFTISNLNESIENLKPYVLYTNDSIESFFKTKNIQIPPPDYSFFGNNPRDDLFNEFHIIQLDNLVNEVDRMLTFNEFIVSNPKVKDNTIFKWINTSRKFWKELGIWNSRYIIPSWYKPDYKFIKNEIAKFGNLYFIPNENKVPSLRAGPSLIIDDRDQARINRLWLKPIRRFDLNDDQYNYTVPIGFKAYYQGNVPLNQQIWCTHTYSCVMCQHPIGSG